MITFTKAILAAIAATIAFSAQAGESQATHVLKPMHGASFEMGTKKVAAYYLAGDKVCDLTVMIGDLPDADGNVSGQSTRINVPLAAGTKSRVYTTEGRALEASCSLTAHIVTLRPLSFTAAVVQ